ncbi:MAG: single-stranded-DNA-specific exonuclease RecJ [Deltaproteobacteria bacterium]|nr:single-stranded-DNA-specific exonuclease RecJ [Deltaproteobacteria bacterium]
MGLTARAMDRATGAEAPHASPAAEDLAHALGLSVTVADVLHGRGFAADERTRRFLAPKLAHLTPPDGMADRAPAAARIARAIRDRETVCLFGDYDCDGVTATAIMAETIDRLGGRTVPVLASRFGSGYGLTEPALERVRATGASLVVTCDCGSSDHAQLGALRASGIDAVVIDHHLVPDAPLPAVAFLNPCRPDCGFPYKGMASCGLALSLAAELRKQVGRELDLRPLLDLVAIGTVADVAPLDGDNRVLVKVGLDVLGAGGRAGLGALGAGAGRRFERPTAQDIAFFFGPRLNAPGRLGDASLALELVLARDAGRAREIAVALERLTAERREIQRAMLADAMADIDAQGWADDPALVLARQGWHPGVVGIVAGRLAQRYRRPAIVVALDGAAGRGSVRAPDGFRIHDALTECADVLESFGGHQAAAGLEVRAERIAALRERWCRVAAAAGAAATDRDTGERVSPVRLDERDDLARVLADLDLIEPCGEGNPAPLVVVGPARVVQARDAKGHLRLQLDWSGRPLGAFWPERGELCGSLGQEVRSFVGRLRRDRWRGGDAAELLVERLCPSP